MCICGNTFSTLFHNAYCFPQYLHHLEVFSTILFGSIRGKIRLWKLWRLFLVFFYPSISGERFYRYHFLPFSRSLLSMVVLLLNGQRVVARCPNRRGLHAGHYRSCTCHVFRFCCSSFLAFKYCSELPYRFGDLCRSF